MNVKSAGLVIGVLGCMVVAIFLSLERHQSLSSVVGLGAMLFFGVILTLFIAWQFFIMAKKNRQLHALVKSQRRVLADQQRLLTVSFPKEFMSHLTQLSAHPHTSAGIEEKKYSFLFGDVRDFTHIVEKMNSHEAFNFLNQIFERIEPCISRNHGEVDKYFGDAVMAFFDGDQSADHAVQAAIAIQHALSEFNQTQSIESVRFGIGINTGMAMIGVLGSKNRLNTTIVADSVNIASRLERLTKTLNAKILISNHTRSLLDANRYLMREIDTVVVRGKSEPVVIYEVFDSDEPSIKSQKIHTRGTLLRGIVFYKAQFFEQAMVEFQACLEAFPEDLAALNYLKRCRYFITYPPPIDDPAWDGIIEDPESVVDHIIRRRSRRVAVEASAMLLRKSCLTESINSDYQMKVNVLELSLTGVKIVAPQPVMRGEVITLAVDFDADGLNLLKLRELCQAVWCHRTDEHNHAVGLEFLTISDETIHQLQSILS